MLHVAGLWGDQSHLFAMDNGEFLVLKQVLTPESLDFPGGNRINFPEACLFFASLQKSFNYLQHHCTVNTSADLLFLKGTLQWEPAFSLCSKQNGSLGVK